MSSGFRTLHAEWTPFDGLSRLSRWPEEPFRAWTRPGCRFLAVESWLYNGTSEVYFSDEVLEAGSASRWLRSDPKALRDEPPAAGIKMLVIEGSSDPFDPMIESYDLTVERSVIETALDAFGLSPATGALLSLESNAPISPELLNLHGPAKHRSATKYLDFPYKTIAWTSTQDGSIIYAICRDDLTNLKHGSNLPGWIQIHISSLRIPLLLPYLACYLATDHNGTMLVNSMDEMRMVEAKSGHHTWTEAGHCLRNIKVSGELTALAEKACGLAAAASSRKTDTHSIQIATRSIIQEYLTTVGVESKISGGLELYESLKVLEGILTSQAAFAEEILQRALIQQTAIFQVTAQRNQGLSLEVAKNSQTVAVQSRRDTVSMEAIAFLTMLILPGAFIAVSVSSISLQIFDLNKFWQTFFAMPVFDWTSADTLTPRFWLYWEITIPLTVLVILLWRLWYTLKLRGHLKIKKTDIV